MNPYPSSNFATVFFLVLVFIGTGVLIYHACEISVENNQLKEALASLQEAGTQLNFANSNLKMENDRLLAENQALVAENARLTRENENLKLALQNASAENASLKAAIPIPDAELEKLRKENGMLVIENLQLKAGMNNQAGAVPEDDPPLFLSILPNGLPSDINLWKAAEIFLSLVILLLSCSIVLVLKRVDLRKP